MNDQALPRWDILGVGTAAVDDLLQVDHFPQPDEKMRVLSILRQGGGQTATALVAASRHHAKTAFFSCLGEDDLSQFTIRELENEKVDCSLVLRVPGCRPFYTVVIVDVTSASRTILYSNQGVDEPDMTYFDPIWLKNSRLLFFDQNVPKAALHVARMAHIFGVPIVADLEKPDLPGLHELLPLIDHLIVNKTFAMQWTGKQQVDEMLQQLALSRRQATIITSGSQGCWYMAAGGQVRHIPALSIKAVDTTGCGDVFHGTYSAAISRGESIDRAVLIANISAGYKATQPGGRAGIPGLEFVEKYLQHL